MKNIQRGYLTPKETAAYLKVSTETVRQWAKTGLLKAETTLGGHRRFNRDEVARFASTLQKRETKKQIFSEHRVLIVDDDKQYVKFVEELIQGFSNQFVTEKAYDGFEAGHKIEQFKPNTIILDLVMPSINGIEVCRYLKQNDQTEHIRIIATTGFPSELNIQNFLQAGAEAVLDKPLNEDLLQQVLLNSSTSSAKSR
ncbi:MAG: response regulator [Gammaproteobacteria bacterium]|jgi:excisionase family DNA binding protein